MSKKEALSCERREVGTKGYLHGLRRQGLVPGIVYARGMDEVPISLVSRDLTKSFQERGMRSLFNLRIKGDKTPILVLVREVQRNPVSGELIHVDFLRVRQDEKITAEVPVHITGEEEVLKGGGVLQTGAMEIQVECLPADLPENFTVDVAGIPVGGKVTVADIRPEAGVAILTPEDTMLAVVLNPQIRETEEGETEEAEAGEAETEA